ncbi:MAG: hypothetical protein PHN69_02180 [Candidatus Pacebacteria bacterium]|nr:hypothetical protein [Candidatus Paceibacterota bacterium]
MKKYTISIFTALLGIFMASSAIASTNITLVPSTVNVIAGQEFILDVYANANGMRNGTVKMKVEFPADLLQVNSFTQPSVWMSIKQDGYELEDNINGVLTKTAIYPRGFTSNLVFGTITFKAKKTGVATVSVTSDSVAYDSSNKNVYSGNSQTIINIGAVVAPVRTTTVVSTTTTTTEDGGLTGQEATVVSALDGLFGTSTDDNLTASVFGSMMGENLWYIIGAVLLLALVLWLLFWKRSKDEENNNKK